MAGVFSYSNKKRQAAGRKAAGYIKEKRQAAGRRIHELIACYPIPYDIGLSHNIN